MKTFTTYHDNGNIKEEYTIHNRIQEGMKSWYENGQVYSEGNYINGKREGLWKYWFDNGQLMSEENYINDKSDGIWKYWHENGQLGSEGNYINGKREGLWKYWFDNGQLMSEENYINDKSDGIWKEWDETGVLTDETLYNNGVKVIDAPVYNIVQKHTDEECLVYKSTFDLGAKYLMCSNKQEHVMDYEFMIGFGRTENLKNIKCVYCSHKVKEEIYEQV